MDFRFPDFLRRVRSHGSLITGRALAVAAFSLASLSAANGQSQGPDQAPPPPPQGYPQSQQQPGYPQQQQPGYPQQQPGYPQQQPGYPQQQSAPPPGQGYPQGYPGEQAPPPPPPPEAGAPPQGQPDQPPPYVPPQQLDQLVQRIALYPDPLLAQVLTASTVWDQIPQAATWADQHASLHGDALAAAIQADNLQWDPSVLALLPFPQVLDMMARDPGWTQALGSAVLAQRGDVMDAVQRDRQQAYSYGYLRSNPYDNVIYDGNYVQIVPVNPAYVYVPYYDPAVVFVHPRPGFAVHLGIRFGPAVVVGGAFAPWGWGSVGFAWGAHNILIDHTPWNRVWVNRHYYVHPYARGWAHGPGPRVEHHVEHRDDHRR